MGLTWRDALSSGVVMLIIALYIAYLGGASLLLISSTWATSALVLVLGVGCAVIATGDLYTKPQLLSGQICRWITTVLGTIALLAGATGLIIGSAHALEILVVTTIALLATATCYHVLTIGLENEPW
jgi:hypothetical protein